MKIRMILVAATMSCLRAVPRRWRTRQAAGPVEVQILAINDFHGNLEPPKLAIDATAPDGAAVKVPAGGVAYLASAAKALRAGKPYSVTVSAGDMIGAAPLVSSLFLDEPTIGAMDLVGVEFNAVGNHEFDKGSAELLRMQNGGCEKHTSRTPCALEPFKGAGFKFLAANVLTAGGGTLVSRHRDQGFRAGADRHHRHDPARNADAGEPGRSRGADLRRRSRDGQCRGAGIEGGGGRRDRAFDPSGRQDQRRL